MTEQASVSILVPVYNASQYLRECLDSIKKQTLSNIEVICVNDGSTDDSLAILQEYAREDNRIKIISQENGGYGAAMNHALDNAQGEYIGIVEPDDYISPIMYEALYAAATKHACDTVKSNRLDVRDGEETFMESYPESDCNTVFSPQESKDCFSTAPNTTTGIYKRSFLLANGIRYNETPGAAYQDTGFSFKVWTYADRALFLHDAFYYYRRDAEGSSSNSRGNPFAINREYSLLRASLESGTKWNSVSDVYCARMFQSYLWTYNRIDWLYRFGFIMAMSAEFSKMQHEGLLKKKLFSEADWLRLNQIVEHPESYFESEKGQRSYAMLLEEKAQLKSRNAALMKEKAQLQSENAELGKKLSSLKQSKTFRVGKAALFLPRKIKGLFKASSS